MLMMSNGVGRDGMREAYREDMAKSKEDRERDHYGCTLKAIHQVIDNMDADMLIRYAMGTLSNAEMYRHQGQHNSPRQLTEIALYVLEIARKRVVTYVLTEKALNRGGK